MLKLYSETMTENYNTINNAPLRSALPPEGGKCITHLSNKMYYAFA